MDEKAIIDKIKRIRKNKNITFKTLAKKTGLTEGYLSRIENSETAPPISTLSRIAQGLDTDISYLLLNEDVSKTKNPNIVIVRNDDTKEDGFFPERPQKTIYGYQFEPLAKEKQAKNMQPYLLIPDFEPGESLQHDGEEFFYVLDGTLEFFYGVDKYVLTKGNCVYFDSHIPHNGRSIGEKKAKVLIIMHSYKRL